MLGGVMHVQAGVLSLPHHVHYTAPSLGILILEN